MSDVVCHWYVQENMSPRDADKWEAACIELEKPCTRYTVRPFSVELPIVNTDEPFVIVGTGTALDNCWKLKDYRPGLFINWRAFTHEQYKKFGPAYLNYDGACMTLESLGKYVEILSDSFFMRVADDSKGLAGGLWTPQKLTEMLKNLTYDAQDPVNWNTKVVVAKPQTILEEYRFVLVEGKVIAGSKYQPQQQASFYNFGTASDFAEVHAERYSPHAVFVMDVGVVHITKETTAYRIIECNTFNGSGMYASNLQHVVRAVSLYQEGRYGQQR
jgi:hypothetical protein